MGKLEAMQTFIRVVDAGTFTRAADLLGVPKSTVSRQVQALEKTLGVRLLHRTSRQLSVTEQGAAYYQGALRLLDQLGILESSVGNTLAAPHGRIRVELPGALAYQLIIPALPDFFDQYPDVQLELSVANRPVDLIAENVDCVIRVGPLMNDSLIARPLGLLGMMSCASPEYLAEFGLPTHPDALDKDHKVIQVVSPKSGRPFASDIASGAERTTLRGAHQIAVNDSAGALVAALAGLGVLTTYAFLVTPHVQVGRLVPLFEQWESAYIPVHVAYSENRHLASKVRVFIDWVVALFAARNV